MNLMEKNKNVFVAVSNYFDPIKITGTEIKFLLYKNGTVGGVMIYDDNECVASFSPDVSVFNLKNEL